MIRAVLFDVTGVLGLPDARWVAARLDELGARADPARLDRAYYLATAAYDEQKGGRAPAGQGPAFGTAYALGAGLAAGQARQVEQVLLGPPVPLCHRIPLPGAESCLRQLAGLGIGIGIVANTKDGRTSAWLRHWRLGQAVNPAEAGRADGLVVTDSAVAGVRKPDPRIFTLTLAQLGVPPAEALHVGDSLYLDIEGSRGAGLRCVHFDPFRLCRRTDHPHAAGLSEVVTHVTQPSLR